MSIELCCILTFAPVSWLSPGALETITCVDCHDEASEQYAGSVHHGVGFGCQECHGGRESYGLDEAKPAGFDHGESFQGKPTRFEIPERCARCHSNVSMMNPYGLPANELMRYKTSGHGKALFEKKVESAAVCTDCHNVHAIYKSNDPRSRTHPLNVPDTCGTCHGNAELMNEFGHDPAIMTEYKQSVHGRGLLQDHDTGMPTCATCHGNHAAAPPGFASVNAVCARCHIQADQFFLQSPHAKIPTFPRCIGCHGGDHAHDIRRLTVSPNQLAERLAAAGAGPKDDALTELIHPGLSQLKETCFECHDEFSDDPADQLALTRSAVLYELIAGGEHAYATTANEVDRVGRGILLVEDERLLLADARTAMIELSATQHTLSAEQTREVAQRLEQSIGQIRSSLESKEQALAWRYQVIGPMWAFIFIFALASYIKYRRLKAAHVTPLT